MALGAASFLGSTAASRLLIVAVVLNPVDAVRTAALMGIEGKAAFGSASLAFLRFTGGTGQAWLMLAFSVIAWTLLPLAVAIRRLRHADV